MSMIQLIGRYENANGRILKFQANTKKSMGRLDTVVAVKGRLDLLETYWQDVLKAEANMKDASYENPKGLEEADIHEFDMVEEEYLAAKAELNLLLINLMEPEHDQGRAIAATGAVMSNGNIRMKAIDAPSFSGEIEDWVSYRDLFQSIIIDNNSLSDVQRLQHLKMSCKGEACDMIKDFQITGDNFTIAWKELSERYENKRLLVSRMLERLLNLPTMTKECPVELASLLNGTSQAIRSLAALGRPIEHWDDWLVVQTSRRLDYTTRLAWEKSIGATVDMPTFAELEVHFRGVLRSFEAVKGCVKKATATTPSTGYKRSVKTFTVETKESCFLCHNGHPLFKCPQFLAKSTVDRRHFISSNGICFNCMGSTRHISRSCPSNYRCLQCQRMHHTLLHSNDEQIAGRVGQPTTSMASTSETETGVRRNPNNPFSRASTNSVVSSNHVNHNERTDNKEVILLPTALVNVTGCNGRTIEVRALIDQGSQASFVSEDTVQRLAIQRKSSSIIIVGIGEATPGRSYGKAELKVSASMGVSRSLRINALILPKLTSSIPNRCVSRSNWTHINGLPLADYNFGRPGRIDLLLGADVFSELLLDGVRHGERSEPVAQQTIFGWVLSGSVLAPSKAATIITSMHVTLDNMLQRFWEQEEVSRRNILSVEDEECEKQYEETTTRCNDGKYVVNLPFRRGLRDLGDSRANAIRRLLQIEQRARKETGTGMFEAYRSFMETYISLGHMEKIPIHELDRQPHCYLPHHAVLKPDSTTTKLRVVFDATLATSNGKGLNDLLMTGPRLQENLTSILMRWRRHRVALSADIEKMYRQIWVSPAHCEYQRIVWRDHREAAVDHYRLKTVTYGTASAPYMAIKTIQQLAKDEAVRFPRAAEVVLNDFYVDDCLSGADNLEDAHRIKDELLGMMNAGGLKLLKWSSNNEDLLRSLPEDHRECRLPLSIDDDDTIKALGIRWHPATDDFAYKVTVSGQMATTKRTMLSEIAKLYDPLGLLALTVITAKIMMQQLWLTGLGWDDVLPEDIQSKWQSYHRELQTLEEVRIRRWFEHRSNNRSIQLHGFADASKTAYAACTYIRVEKENGEVEVTLLAAKTKVAPIKHQSIPRLELNGAVLLAQLMAECKRAIRIDGIQLRAWTDSTVVLAWLRRHSNVWPTYVANRVSEIHSTMTCEQWRHVSGHENPADVASRGVMPSEVRQHELWWNGPSWLWLNETEWPKPTHLEVDVSLLEEKTVVSCQTVTKEAMFELTERVSSWPKLLRVTAYCRRLLPTSSHSNKALTAGELEEARLIWIRLAQEYEFSDLPNLQMNKLEKGDKTMMRLRPYVDDRGILRVGGRLQKADMSYEERHPCILPGHNKITELIIRDAHEKTLHGGPQQTIGQLHQRYWILKERRQVRSIIHRCITCFKARPTKHQQLMGNLPAARITPSRPFMHTGIDYAGPIWTRTSKGRGQKSHKSWIAVFICFSTKAVHLELVSELTTEAFIAAFKRFVARRGRCSDIYCDNGTNFVGADRELRRCIKTSANDMTWASHLAESGTRFHFAPAGSPHFNGLAEAAVKMSKTALKKIIGETRLTYEEMCTFLAQVEAVLNSRPLCAVSMDGADENVLTPGHFLVGHPLTAVPEPNYLIGTRSMTNRWKATQQMVQHFWKRWAREYQHHLQQLHKWKSQTQNIEIGDIALIQDETLPPMKWKIGLVVETHPGEDGIVRVVSLRTCTGSVIRRAIVKISVLPMEKPHTGNNNNHTE